MTSTNWKNFTCSAVQRNKANRELMLHLPALALATAVLSFGTASARLLAELLSFLKKTYQPDITFQVSHPGSTR
jgi:hypothetical protein